MPFLTIGLCSSLSQENFNKLKEIGYLNVAEFCNASVETISRRCSIPLADVQAIRHVVLTKYSCIHITGDILMHQMTTSMAILPTGCNSLNQLLDGGLFTSEMTEVYGCSATGKTQLCLNCALAVIMEANQNCIFIDTCGSFNISHINNIALCKGYTEEQCEEGFKRLECHKIFNIFDLLSKLNELQDRLCTKLMPFDQSIKLVVIDCLAPLLSPIIGSNFVYGCELLSHVSRSLKSLAVDHSLAILISNTAVEDKICLWRPALGKTWGHASNTRLLLTRYKSERYCSIMKSCRQSFRTISFKISNKGCEDYGE